MVRGCQSRLQLYSFFSSCPPHLFCDQLCNALVKALLPLVCLWSVTGVELAQGKARGCLPALQLCLREVGGCLAVHGAQVWRRAQVGFGAQMGFTSSEWCFWWIGVSAKQWSAWLYFSPSPVNLNQNQKSHPVEGHVPLTGVGTSKDHVSCSCINTDISQTSPHQSSPQVHKNMLLQEDSWPPAFLCRSDFMTSWFLEW